MAVLIYIICEYVGLLLNIHEDTIYLNISGHAMPIRSICFSPDSQLLVTASDDASIKLYDV